MLKISFGLLMLLLSGSSLAASLEHALMVNLGYGPQPSGHVSQRNFTSGVDLEFYRFQRSPRQWLSLGLSYSYLASDTEQHRSLHALSLYPQLTLLGEQYQQWQPWFFVRALGPTYLSEKQLGSRQQAKHFAFQAQVGIGATHLASQWQVALSYKHFSNANLDSPNDGFDIPLVFNFGKRF
ncbi:acyloxyacyl hydrolase [Agarivorans gilvus]|jgi:hypothetical protein|uniref:Acyloxyacyl hydrolase n=1 Tax=Agarivorans gilvus TaxID=680279 RepID=A0ABQ1I3G1_9ALTE|nr:acyloxyacyl hydrolase [Agarivorans gilvus]GGB07877.1 hypothetical protein GCM10007414_21550 [Agarivorans gilvus]